MGGARQKQSRRRDVTTSKGLSLIVKRTESLQRVSYTAMLKQQKGMVAWFRCNAPMYGRVQVKNAQVHEVRGKDYRRQGIGTAVYDLIERDVRAAGAGGASNRTGGR
jgi:hypothetical protein